MADRILVVCTGCSAKLAVSDASKLGKKIRCSKCSEVFVAKAASANATKSAKPSKPAPPAKKKKSDDDEFNFDDMEMEDKSEFDDDDSEDEAPVVKSKAKATSKSPVKKGKGKGKGKSSGNNLPLIIGGSVAALLIVGVGLYFLLSGGEPPAAAPVAQQPVGVAPAVLAAPAVQNFPGDRILALKWLPQETEVIVHLKVGDLWSAPLLQGLVASPQTKPIVQQMQQFTGLAPTDIESITIGVRDLQGMQGQAMMMAMGGQAPKNQHTLIVVRSKKPVDPAALSSQIAQAGAATGMKLADHGGKQYIEAPAAKPGDKVMGAWFADANTLVGGPTDELFAAMDRGESITPRNEFRAVDPSPHLLFVVAPKNPQAMSQSAPIPPGASPAAAEIQKAIQETLTGVSFGVSVRGGADLQTSLVCKDSAGSSKLKASFEALIVEAKQSFAAKKATAPPLLFELGEMLLNNVQITDQNQVVKLVTNVPDSAQQKLEQLPTMLMGAMMFGGNPFALSNSSANAPQLDAASVEMMQYPGLTESVPTLEVTGLPSGCSLSARASWKPKLVYSKDRQPEFPPQILLEFEGEMLKQTCGFGRVEFKTIQLEGGGAGKPIASLDYFEPQPLTQFVPFISDELDPGSPVVLRIVVPFEMPQDSVTKLAVLEGAFVLRTYENTEEITIDDVRTVVGKPLTHPALKSSLLLYLNRNSAEIRGVKSETEQLVASIQSGFAAGVVEAWDSSDANIPTMRLIPTYSVGNGPKLPNGGVDTRILERPLLPQKLSLRVHLRSKLKEVKVPFRFENVPLPKPEAMPKLNAPNQRPM